MEAVVGRVGGTVTVPVPAVTATVEPVPSVTGTVVPVPAVTATVEPVPTVTATVEPVPIVPATVDTAGAGVGVDAIAAPAGAHIAVFPFGTGT